LKKYTGDGERERDATECTVAYVIAAGGRSARRRRGKAKREREREREKARDFEKNLARESFFSTFQSRFRESRGHTVRVAKYIPRYPEKKRGKRKN